MRSCAAVTTLVLVACGGGGTGAGGGDVVVRDSAGIAIVEHSAGAVEAVPLSRPGEPELSIGGLETDEDHDATFLTRAWIRDDGLLALNGRESRFVRFDAQGAVTGTYGRRGDGPDEFQAMLPLALGGDSLMLVEMMRSDQRVLRGDLTTGETVRFAEEPSFRYAIFGAHPDGSLFATQQQMEPSTERSGPQRREEVAVVLMRAGTTTWDTLLMSRGELSYPTVGTEGGQEFPVQRMVTFGDYPYRAVWGDGLVLVDNSDWTVAVHTIDGALRQLIRLDLPRRPVTAAMRDSVLARDARQIEQFAARVPQQMKDQFLAMSREQQFADSVAPYDRILTTRDGLLWMRINEMPVDSTTGWFGFGREGRLERRLELPKRWMLLDADGERILVRRLDDDDIGYLEVRSLERIAP